MISHCQEFLLKTQFFKFLNQIHSSFWFIPVLMISASLGAAFAMLALDRIVDTEWLNGWGWAFQGDADAASNLMQTVASAMITIASVVFSMTLVVLSLTSTQYGPRLISNFMRDLATKVSLGAFTATFLYCLVVMRAIRHADAGTDIFIPQLSVLSALLLALLSVFILIYFIHHISVSIQANQIQARIGKELNRRIDELFPHQVSLGNSSKPPAPGEIPENFEREAVPVYSEDDGYIETVDAEDLLKLACRKQLLIKIGSRPGDYVIAGRPLVWVWPPQQVDRKLEHDINLLFAIENQRTPGQDIIFMINELVEIALRALSPSLNDPLTAMGSLDRLGSALCRLTLRDEPLPCSRDDDGKLKLIVPVVAFAEIADAAFNPIRQNCSANVQVTLRLLDTIAEIAQLSKKPEHRAALRRQVNMVADGARRYFREAADIRDMEKRYHNLCTILASD